VKAGEPKEPYIRCGSSEFLGERKGHPGACPMTLCYELCNKSLAVAEMGGRLATIDKGRKMEAVVPVCPFPLGELGPPSNTVWPGPRSTSVPSGILIHSTVWPQYTNITDRRDRKTITWHRAKRYLYM